MAAQKPLELILARNLLSSISTPAFLVGEEGALLFYNEAAAVLVGKRFEEIGRLSAQQWTTLFGPFGEDDQPISYERLPATHELSHNRPYHGNFRICAADGQRYEIAASAIPIVGRGGSSGAIVFFWPVNREDECSPEEGASATATLGAEEGASATATVDAEEGASATTSLDAEEARVGARGKA